MMAKMMKLMPEVTNTLGATMKDFGFDPATVPNAVMKAVSGNFDDLLNTEEEEICD